MFHSSPAECSTHLLQNAPLIPCKRFHSYPAECSIHPLQNVPFILCRMFYSSAAECSIYPLQNVPLILILCWLFVRFLTIDKSNSLSLFSEQANYLQTAVKTVRIHRRQSASKPCTERTITVKQGTLNKLGRWRSRCEALKCGSFIHKTNIINQKLMSINYNEY